MRYSSNEERADGISHNFWHRFVLPNLFRIKNDKCEMCGSKRYLEANHTDYIDVNIDTLKLLCKRRHGS
jgi:hypothetical protein